MDWRSICSDADTVPSCCGGERAECESEAVDLLAIYVTALTYGCFWYPEVLGTDQKNEIVSTRCVSGPCLRYGRSLVKEGLRNELLLLHFERSELTVR